MKKLILALSIAAMAAIPMTTAASAANIINDAGRAAETIVGDAVSGVEGIVKGAETDISDIVPGGNSGAVTDNSTSEPVVTTPATTTAPTGPNGSTNEATGVAAAEFIGLSVAAVGGLTAMAVTARKKR